MPTPTSSSLLWSVLILSVASAAGPAAAQSSTATTPRTIEHRVPVRSTVPAIEGQMTELYVRERVLPATLEGSNVEEGRVVLFVHGAGTPAEVAFDVPYATYSWMAHLASAGFDVFSVDMTGY